MTDLIDEPQFKVDACISSYHTNTMHYPDLAIVLENAQYYLNSIIKSSLLENSWGAKIKVYRMESLPKRAKEKFKPEKGIAIYLCQTGTFGRIKEKSIRSYNLEDATSNLSRM